MNDVSHTSYDTAKLSCEELSCDVKREHRDKSHRDGHT